MSQSVEDIRADLAYMKDVVEDGGGNSSLRRSGAILLAAGLIYGLTSFGFWAAWLAHLRVTPMINLFAGLAPTALFLLALALISRGSPKRERAPGERAITAAWSSVGGAIFALAGACMLMMFTTKYSFQWALFPSVIMALYGAGWMVSGVVTRKRWMLNLSGASLVCAVALGYLVTTPHGMLAYGVMLIALAAIPGWHLMRQPARA